jgi:hypothetical protein
MGPAGHLTTGILGQAPGLRLLYSAFQRYTEVLATWDVVALTVSP